MPQQTKKVIFMLPDSLRYEHQILVYTINGDRLELHSRGWRWVAVFPDHPALQATIPVNEQPFFVYFDQCAEYAAKAYYRYYDQDLNNFSPVVYNPTAIDCAF